MQPAKFPGPQVHDYRQNFQDHESMITAFLSNSISLAVLEQANFFLIVYDNWQMLHNLCFMYIHKKKENGYTCRAAAAKLVQFTSTLKRCNGKLLPWCL